MIGFIAGWVSLIAGFTGAIAIAAIAFESYILPAINSPDWLPPNVVAIGVVVIGGLAHGLRARGGAAFQNTAVVTKLGLLIGFIVLTVVRPPESGWEGGPVPNAPSGAWPVTAAISERIWVSAAQAADPGSAVATPAAMEERRK